MSDKTSKIFAAILFILAVVMVLLPVLIAPTCPMMPNGKFMKCHWMGKAVEGIGVMMALISLIMIFAKSSGLRMGLGIANILAGVLALSQTKLIGGCKSPEMACNARTIPGIYLVAGVFIVISIFYVIKNRNYE